MPPKIYKSEAEKKAAYALNKKLKRAADKEKKLAAESNHQWILQYLLQIANDVTQIVERKKTDAKQKAVKRSAVKEGANILPKRQKYAK